MNCSGITTPKFAAIVYNGFICRVKDLIYADYKIQSRKQILCRYLIQDILCARREISIEEFRLQEVVPEREGIIEGRLRFWDGFLLEFVEVLIEHGLILINLYSQNIQDLGLSLIPQKGAVFYEYISHNYLD